MTQCTVTREANADLIAVYMREYDELVKNAAMVDSLMSIVNATPGKYIEKAMIYAVFCAEVPEQYKLKDYTD